ANTPLPGRVIPAPRRVTQAASASSTYFHSLNQTSQWRLAQILKPIGESFDYIPALPRQGASRDAPPLGLISRALGRSCSRGEGQAASLPENPREQGAVMAITLQLYICRSGDVVRRGTEHTLPDRLRLTSRRSYCLSLRSAGSPPWSAARNL